VINAQEGNVQEDSYNWNNRPPDERFKADVLLIVAHPDDEIMAAAYIARAVDQKRRVAIVWMNCGNEGINGGVNKVGPEQATAEGEIRQLEGMRAAAVLGVINVWNLGASDTPSQNPLESLEGNGHGRLLGRMVRLVRLTRPTVILTWLPVFVTGENHSDHQASGVLATEAFGLAGDPTAFPEQVSPAREPNHDMNRTEGLRPWQPEKLYYFTNATHNDFFAGQGPQYYATDVSPVRHVSYGEIAGECFSKHMTQEVTEWGKAKPPSANQEEGGPYPLRPVRLILGKSLVSSGVTDDVFTGVVPSGIAYQRPPGFIPAKHTEPVVEIGDPWQYYRLLWQAHGLDRLFGLVPEEVSIPVGGTLNIPLIIDNPFDTPIDVNISVHAPDGWKVAPVAPVHIDPQNHRYYLRVQAAAPTEMRKEWQQFTVTAESGNKTIGTVPLRVQLTRWAFPQ
jgi:LmbE family N-acetylglucosaminyl deacetylase